MSLGRLNRITMSGVLPFNFGMDRAAWLRCYAIAPEMVGSDPAEWTAEEVADCERRAAEEIVLCDRLMGLGEEEFRAELRRLERERGRESP